MLVLLGWLFCILYGWLICFSILVFGNLVNFLVFWEDDMNCFGLLWCWWLCYIFWLIGLWFLVWVRIMFVCLVWIIGKLFIWVLVLLFFLWLWLLLLLDWCFLLGWLFWILCFVCGVIICDKICLWLFWWGLVLYWW